LQITQINIAMWYFPLEVDDTISDTISPYPCKNILLSYENHKYTQFFIKVMLTYVT